MPAEKEIRKLAAIMHADVKGYSRLMGEDESHTVRALEECRQLFAENIGKHGGRVVNAPGDSILAEFPSVVSAVQCAAEIQDKLKARNADLPDNRKMLFRIGVNLGDVIQRVDAIYGDGVNIAARIEALAEPGTVYVSSTVYGNVHNKLKYGYEFKGEHEVKNIAKPVRVYKVLTAPGDAGKLVGEEPKPLAGRWIWPTVVVAAIFLSLIGNHLYQKLGGPEFEPASVEKMAYPLPEKPSIAVLAFDNMSNDPKEDYFSDGLTEQIITNLSKFHRLFVIARNSTFVYKGKPVKVQKVAEDLGVQYVLEGSIQKSGDKVRITVQLIDALTGHHVWSERYDRKAEDIFALQDEITLKIGKAMKVELTEGEPEHHFAKWETDNLKAFEKNYQGLGFIRRGAKQDNDKARQLFEEAITIDPKYIFPVALLGYTHFYDARFGWSESPVKSVQKAFELAQKAIAMDDSFDGAHTLMAGVYLLMGQHDKAIAEAEQAVAINPNGVIAYMTLAGVVGSAGKWEDSILYAKKAMRLNPFLGPEDYWFLGRAYFMTGQYDESIATWKKALKVNPDYLLAHLYLSACYSSIGQDKEATGEAEKVLRINPKFTIESYAKTIPYRDKTDVERELAALRKAGLK